MTYKMSPGYFDALTRSHTIDTKAIIVGQTGGLYDIDLKIVEGSATCNMEDTLRRQCDLTLVNKDRTLTVTEAQNILAPFGVEVAIFHGIVVDGVPEYKPWGVYRLDDWSASSSTLGVEIAIKGFDRAYRIQQPSPRPITIAGGTDITQAIVKICKSRYAALEFEVADSGFATGPLYFEASSDMWASCVDLAKSIGARPYFNAEGVLMVTDSFSEVDTVAPFAFTHDTNNLLSIDRRINADGLPNGVRVTGTPKGRAPAAVDKGLTKWQYEHNVEPGEYVAQGEAWDEDPSSYTYRHGDYGEVIKEEELEYVYTNRQAEQAAAGILDQELGPYETVSMGIVPNGALDTGDIAFIEDSDVGATGLYMVSDIELPFGPEDEMPVTARRRINRARRAE